MRLPGRTVIQDRNGAFGNVHVTHDDGAAIIGISRPTPAPEMPETTIDPIARSPELDLLLSGTLTLRPPTPITAWLLS